MATDPDHSARPEVNAAAYERYFSSGLYDERYPKANSLTLSKIVGLADSQQITTIVDFGAGSGRYALALKSLRPKVRVIAIERDSRARSLLEERAQTQSLRVEVRANQSAIDPQRPVLVISIFGVISHMTSDGRKEFLDWAHEVVAQSGAFVASVPNARRRFYRAQVRALRNGHRRQIEYERDSVRGLIGLAYKLFTVSELRDELTAAGFLEIDIRAESIFPESAVATRPYLAKIDRWLSSRLPAVFGYGLIAVARSSRP